MRLPTSNPSTVSDAAGLVLDAMSAEEKRHLAGMEKDDLISLHFGLGMAIRNQFGLWSGNESLFRDCVRVSERPYLGPDDASMVIIEEAWRQSKEGRD